MVMIRLPKDLSLLTPSEREEHRRAGRIRCDAVKSSVGLVLDISATGVLIKRTKAATAGSENNPVVIWIESPGGDRVFIKVRLVRSKRLGWRRHEAAYEFDGLSDEKRLQLNEIARCSVRHEHGFGDR